VGDWCQYQYYGGNVAVGISQQNVIYTVSLPGQNATFESNRFTFANGAFYRGIGIDRLHTVHFRAHVVATAGAVLGISVVASDYAGGREQKYRLPAGQTSGEISMSIPIHLSQGGLAIGIKNITDANDVTLSDIDIVVSAT
jgi:hypothetical protein